jgi:hypothetical protein
MALKRYFCHFCLVSFYDEWAERTTGPFSKYPSKICPVFVFLFI